MIKRAWELRALRRVQLTATIWSTRMSIRPIATWPRLLVGSLALTWPLLAFAEPPAGPEPDGMGPGDSAMHGGMMGPMGGMMHGEGHAWGMQPHFLHGLKLSEEQQDKVFAILHAAAPALREQAKAMRKAHEGLHQLMTSDKYDDAKAKSLADAAAKAVSQLALLWVRAAHDVYALLTPEQRAQIAEHRHGMGARHHDGPPPHP
jgi:periplasmic protein CpxP/Spy